MNLSKKSIKHILRILDNKCVENPSKTTTISFGGNRIPTREFTPKNKEAYDQSLYYFDFLRSGNSL